MMMPIEAIKQFAHNSCDEAEGAVAAAKNLYGTASKNGIAINSLADLENHAYAIQRMCKGIREAIKQAMDAADAAL